MRSWPDICFCPYCQTLKVVEMPYVHWQSDLYNGSTVVGDRKQRKLRKISPNLFILFLQYFLVTAFFVTVRYANLNLQVTTDTPVRKLIRATGKMFWCRCLCRSIHDTFIVYFWCCAAIVSLAHPVYTVMRSQIGHHSWSSCSLGAVVIWTKSIYGNLVYSLFQFYVL